MRLIPVQFALVALCAFTLPANASTLVATCVKPIGTKATPEARRAACLALIKSGKYKGRELARYWTNVGSSYWSQRQWQKAVEAHTKAIEADPTYYRGWQSRAVNYNNLKKYKLALSDYNRAVTLNPRSPWPVGNRCGLLVNMGRLDDALKDCLRAAEIKRSDWSLNGVAYVYFKKGQWAQAAEWGRQALKFNPDYAWANLTYGRTLAAMGKRDTAIRHLKKAQGLSKDSDLQRTVRKALNKLNAKTE